MESAPWTLPSYPLWPVEQKANWESLVDAFGKLKVNLAFCSGPTQGNLPVWTLSRGPPGCHDAPGQLDQAWSHTEPQRFSWDCRFGWAAAPSPVGPEGLHQLHKIPKATEGLIWGLCFPTPTLVLPLWPWRLGWPHIAPAPHEARSGGEAWPCLPAWPSDCSSPAQAFSLSVGSMTWSPSCTPLRTPLSS